MVTKVKKNMFFVVHTENKIIEKSIMPHDITISTSSDVFFTEHKEEFEKYLKEKNLS